MALNCGRVEVLKWLDPSGDQSGACNWAQVPAAKRGNLDFLKWAHEIGCAWSEGACYAAAQNGHLDVLQWLRTIGCPWHPLTCFQEDVIGSVELVQELVHWARENGCPYVKGFERTIKYANDRQLDELKRLRAENDSPWNETTCAAAAGGGHLEVLQWACANGCPWHEWVRQRPGTSR